MLKTILVPLDVSPMAEEAIGPASSIARTTGASIDVVTVHLPLRVPRAMQPGGAPPEERLRSSEDDYVDSVAATIHTITGVKTTHAVLGGPVAEAIAMRARDIGASLIVMTSHGRTGMNRALFGSVADGVMRTSEVPVLMIRPKAHAVIRPPRLARFTHILVPVDGSPLSAEILEPVRELAAATGASVLLLRVVTPASSIELGPSSAFGYPPAIVDEELTARVVEESRLELHRFADQLKTRGLRSVEAHVIVATDVGTGIVDFARAQDVDLVAMSTHGRGVSRLLISSVGDRVIKGTTCAVMLYRPRISDLLAHAAVSVEAVPATV